MTTTQQNQKRWCVVSLDSILLLENVHRDLIIISLFPSLLSKRDGGRNDAHLSLFVHEFKLVCLKRSWRGKDDHHLMIICCSFSFRRRWFMDYISSSGDWDEGEIGVVLVVSGDHFPWFSKKMCSFHSLYRIGFGCFYFLHHQYHHFLVVLMLTPVFMSHGYTKNRSWGSLTRYFIAGLHSQICMTFTAREHL